jgi:hypothetical protein
LNADIGCGFEQGPGLVVDVRSHVKGTTSVHGTSHDQYCLAFYPLVREK